MGHGHHHLNCRNTYQFNVRVKVRNGVSKFFYVWVVVVREDVGRGIAGGGECPILHVNTTYCHLILNTEHNGRQRIHGGAENSVIKSAEYWGGWKIFLSFYASEVPYGTSRCRSIQLFWHSELMILVSVFNVIWYGLVTCFFVWIYGYPFRARHFAHHSYYSDCCNYSSASSRRTKCRKTARIKAYKFAEVENFVHIYILEILCFYCHSQAVSYAEWGNWWSWKLS